MTSRGRERDTHVGHQEPLHQRPARATPPRWGVWAMSFGGALIAVVLISLLGSRGATADVPAAVQIGATPVNTVPSGTATTTTTLARPSTTTSSRSTTTTLPVTTTTSGVSTSPSSASTTTIPATTTPSTTTTLPPPTTTTTGVPVTIVKPKPTVNENNSGSDDGTGDGSDDGSGGSDDGSGHSGGGDD